MSAILHCIVVGIENDRISNMLRIWRWRKDVERNRKLMVKEFKATFGRYDEEDMQYPFWRKKQTGRFPWQNEYWI